MNELEFEILDNDKRTYARYSLERLKTLAPTLPERSRQRLACMELIAERERLIAEQAIRTASRRSLWALVVSLFSLFLSLGFVLFFVTRPFEKKQQPPISPKPISPTPTPMMRIIPDSTPAPLPPLLSSPPATE